MSLARTAMMTQGLGTPQQGGLREGGGREEGRNRRPSLVSMFLIRKDRLSCAQPLNNPVFVAEFFATFEASCWKTSLVLEEYILWFYNWDNIVVMEFLGTPCKEDSN